MKHRKKLLEPSIHVAIWLAGYSGVLFFVNTLGTFSKAEGTMVLPVTLGTAINVVLFYLTALVLIPRYAQHRRGWLLLAQVLGLLLGLTFAESLIDWLLFINYYSDAPADQGFVPQLFISLVLNTVVLSAALGYGFIKKWIRTERQRQQLKQEVLSAELNFLKAQVNPHFLFNVLNMAYASAAAHGDEQTSGIIEKLANLMRYMLYESNVPTIELYREISYIESFIELQKLRLSPDLQATVQLQVEGDCSQYRIVPLLLIPFVENAFKHGIRLEEKSGITFKVKAQGGQLYFRSENTIARKKNELEQVGGVGLDNVRKRLQLLYPNGHSLHTTVKGDTYTAELILNLA